jgi:biopolymer transport protein ExbD
MDENQFESLNMVPFIDIMLVLLTIVLTTSSFIASGKIPVNLPQASTSQADSQKVETIAIDANGAVYFRAQPLATEQLKLQLATLSRDTPVLLQADQAVQLQRFIDVADLLKQLGFAKVAVQTEARRS